ncbi:hypothetical protein BDL97_06G048100 [Sphagnum fallax]|nr:hypothetical protein BDL97_06G048100 [Sphagnum fallax]
MKLKMEESQAKMQAKCDKLQVRFENREPRPEDLAQIGALKEAIEKKDAAIKRKQVENNQIKLELLNREETYNKLFGNTPKVQQVVSATRISSFQFS